MKHLLNMSIRLLTIASAFIGAILYSPKGLAVASSVPAQIEVNSFSPYSNCTLVPKKRASQTFRGTSAIQMEYSADQKTLSIPVRQLAMGNCVSQNSLPKVVQLLEGEQFNQEITVRGVPAIQNSKNTIFIAQWDRPTQNTIRVYGGCNWQYTCGPVEGFAEIIYTSEEK